ncbi:MAG: recombinase family protein [Oscillospiraceae bacterium]|nr:recombinase family protein [Oscillospiraceae bacterium]
MPSPKQKEAIDQRKIAIYSRKSKFTGKGESIENQVELCRERAKFAALQEGKVLSEDDFLVFEDEGFSGGTLDRPSFQRMMQAVRAGRIGMIICYRLDRISRNTGDFAHLIQELEERGVAFISVRDSFDTTSPTGKAMMMMVSVFSQLERETIAERVRDNMIALAKTGRWLGGQTPTGYASRAVERITEDGKARRLYQLEQLPAEIALVKLIYQMFLDTNSFNQIETYLLQKHILTKQKKDFTRFAIKNILQNPVYMIADAQAYQYFNALTDVFADESQFNGTCGVMAYNKTKQKNGRANEYRDVTEWIIAVGKHEGVIPGRDWVRVQQQIAQNSKAATEGKKKKSRSNVALLSGLLFCEHCGDYMRPKLSQRWSAEYNETIYDYLCETKEKSHRKNCDCPRANGNTLDRLVCEEVKRLSADGSEFLRQLEMAKTKLRGQSDEQEALLASLQKELDGKEKSIAGLVNSLAETGQTSAREYIIAQIDALHEEKKTLAGRIAELENMAESHSISDEDFDILVDMLRSFAASFEQMSVEQKRSALRAFVQRVDWDGETAKISFFGAEKAAAGELFYQCISPRTSPAGPPCPH